MHPRGVVSCCSARPKTRPPPLRSTAFAGRRQSGRFQNDSVEASPKPGRLEQTHDTRQTPGAAAEDQGRSVRGIMARQPPNSTESQASLGAMDERNAVEAAFDDGVRSRKTPLRFCPYLNRMMLLCLTPFVFCFLAVVAEVLAIPWLTFYVKGRSL